MLSIIRNGDEKEREAWDLFLKNRFPAYEKFWQIFVVMLTQRPIDLYFKNDEVLLHDFIDEDVKTIHERICIAQLHYSLLNFLLTAFHAKRVANTNFAGVTECFSALYSALDIGAELLGRFDRLKNKEKLTVDCFSPESVEDAKAVRRKWQRKTNSYPVEILSIRNYRDNLVHGRMMSYAISPAAGYITLPQMGKETEYFDWRKAIDGYTTGSSLADITYSGHLVDDAFDTVVKYLQKIWSKYLIV